VDEHWLVTGALGCIGAWVVRVLVDEGAHVTTLDLATDGPRLDLVAGPERIAVVDRRAGDITDPAVVASAVLESGATHVVHLAALQVPFCKADPPLGAHVNVVGTVNVFEAVAATNGHVRGLAYASSIAAYDALDVGARGQLQGQPSTLYGVYKRANEGTAHIYWHDRGVASIGLRPHTVYGPGRDQGLTSQPTAAMLAAARGEPFHIGFGGRLSMQYAEDVARDFVAAARAATDGAHLANVSGTVASVAEIVAEIEAAVPAAAGTITFTDEALPFPEDVPSPHTLFVPAPRTTLAEGVATTIATFR
jgi:UDP-glucuronate 4-epimerase